MAEELIDIDVPDHLVMHVLSDSTGRTASSVVCGAIIQFPSGTVDVRGLTHVTNVDQVKKYVERYVDDAAMTACFHTIIDADLRDKVRTLLDERGIPSIDLLGPATKILTRLLQEDPVYTPNATMETALYNTHLMDASFLDLN